MTNAAPVRRNVILHLSKISAAQGNSGPQWELEGDVSALPGEGGNWGQWPPRFWIDSDGPQPVPGDYQCIIERGAKKKDEYSGDVEFHWRWKMIAFNNSEPVRQVPQSSTPDVSGTMPRGESDADRRERVKQDSIHRQVALKAAVELTIAYPPPNVDDVQANMASLRLANSFYVWLTHAEPIADNDADEPQPESGDDTLVFE